jgi:cyclohexyl-isocyanide hydratase
MPRPLTIGLLLYEGAAQLDLTGPHEVFARMPDTRVLVVAKSREPVRTDGGLVILPTAALAECPRLDVICVPGGPGQVALMDDAEVLGFLRRQAATARYVTAVCTGSLVLAAAGLLTGYRAACHWLSRDQLALFGAQPAAQRVVIDRNRVTGGGVTAGIDFALTLAAELFGRPVAEAIQLGIEYDPAPPFPAGSPESADPAVVERVRAAAAARQAERRAVAERAAARLAQTEQ